MLEVTPMTRLWHLQLRNAFMPSCYMCQTFHQSHHVSVAFCCFVLQRLTLRRQPLPPGRCHGVCDPIGASYLVT